jgi:hypothetical protein
MTGKKVVTKAFLMLITIFMVCFITSEAEAKKGFYVGAGAVYNTIQGDFDGTSGLSGGTEVLILPKIDNAFGFNILAGYGITDGWAVELNFMEVEHNGTWQGLSGNVDYISFSISGKYNFLNDKSTQPYLLFGISNNRLVIKNGATDTLAGLVGDATLTGPGVQAGGGVDQYLGQHVSVTVGALYRYVDYTAAKGIQNSGSIDNSLNGSGFSLLFGVAYHF